MDKNAFSLSAPFVRSPYNYDAMKVSNETALSCLDVSLAVQDQRDECDINTIVRRFGLTGQLPENVRAPTYGDFTVVVDYQSAMNAILEAEASFMTMPADVRSRFDNDAGKFVDFCSDDKNRDEAKKLGLLMPDVEPPAPVLVQVQEPVVKQEVTKK